MEYGLIGEKLGHSFSKIIHESIMDYTYDLKEIPKDQLDHFMKEKAFKAINVTIPYKQDVIPYLDFIDERAKMIGAVNCIVNKDGKLYGYNTDFDGVIDLLKYKGIEIKDRHVLILGTGGTSKTVKAVCDYLGAKSITKVSRTAKDGAIDYKTACEMKQTQIIFNTTPSGMYPNNQNCPFNLDGFEQLEGVLDMIYNPIHTNLIVQALQKGIKADGGLYMLVGQAVSAIEKFKDIHLDSQIVTDVYLKLLREKRNIVFTGMPGCGKSTIARYLCQKMNKEVVDLDEQIVLQQGIAIADIFSEVGESGFRDIESNVIAQFSKKNNLIISTGGGAILRKENIVNLKQNGIVVYLDRELEKLQTGHGRPLSADFQALKKRYDERHDIYLSTADIIVNNNGTIEETLKEIEEKL